MARTNAVTRCGLLALLAMALTLPSSVLAQESETRPVRVYVFTAAPEGGFVDAESKGRADSLKDVRKALGKKKKTIVMVEDQSTAEISLEVKGRNWGSSGSTSISIDPVFGGIKNTADNEAVLHTVLTVGDYTTEIGGVGGHRGMVWSIAAQEVAGRVDKWIKDNAARIPRK